MTVLYRTIPEQHVEGKPLGRQVKHDDRSREFPARQAPAVVDVLHACHGALPFNQGQTGSCTGNALTGSFNLDPNFMGRGLFYEKDAQWIYHQEVTTVENVNPFRDVGGSGVDVCKAAVNARWISGFTHTFSLEGALKALVLRPGMAGVNWYDSFDTPASDGEIKITPGAQIRGGHMFVGVAIDASNQRVWWQQSWGLGWGVVFGGVPGRFYTTFDTFGTLLSQQGDFTVPVR